jgi:4-amino-4-deoxy-L-arabinose transferase-like glycosyltransferase
MPNKKKFISSTSLGHFITVVLIVGVFMAGLYLRIEMANKTVVNKPIMKDAAEYYLYAYNLEKYGVYSRQRPQQIEDGTPVPDAHRTPGYSLFLLPFINIYPPQKMAGFVVLTQAIISALTILTAFVLFRSFLSRPWALGGAFLVAISPHLVTFNIYVLTESLFTFFLVLLGWSLSAVAQNKSWQQALIAGLVLGVSLLIRPTMLYFIAFLIPAFFVFFQKKRARVLAVFLIIGFGLTYGPWVLRNKLAKPVKSTLAIATIHKGMYPNLTFNNDSKTYGFPNLFDPQWKQRQDMSSVLREIFRRFRNEPLEYIRWYLIGKPSMFFSWEMVVGMGDVFVYPVLTSPYHHHKGFFGLTHRVMYSLHGLLTMLALLTSIFVWFPLTKKMLSEKGLIVARFVSLLLIYFSLVHIVGTPLPRYSVPLRPFSYGMAILGIRLMVTEGPKYIRKTQTDT